MPDENTKEDAAPAVEKAPKISQNGVIRPKAGTKTARVWEIADELSAAKGGPAKRADVITKGQGEELNIATAATQYGRWRKFHGLKGSDEPTEAVAAPSAAAGDVSVEAQA